MANNRLYIKCKHCGSLLYIAKNFGYAYFTQDDDITNELNNFFTEHAFCQSNIKHHDGGNFELIDEWGDD